MECNVCGFRGSKCQENTTRQSFFYAYLDNNYLESLAVACFVREQLNSMVGKLFLALGPNQEEYVFNLKKGMYMTHIFGDGYKEFVTNYDLNAGDRIRVEMYHPPPYFHVKGQSREPPSDESDDDSEEIVLEYEGTVSVFTNRLKLTDAQTDTKNNRVLAWGIGMGAILMHKLTESDVYNNGLKIPKRIVIALKINKDGWAILRIGDNPSFKDAAYHRSPDGRIRFKTGWATFVEDFNLEAGLVVLVMFHRDDDGYVNITFDVL